MVQSPAVTVLMPIYNGAHFLREAIESILCQSFADFEFLIIDDGSTDESMAIVRSYTDHRIRLESNGTNMGLVETLNRGMRLARGRYIARMDSDDISHPERLAQQTSFMDQHIEVVVCGGWIKAFGSQRFVKKYPLTDDGIRTHLLFENALAHPSVMMRRDLFLSEHLFYDANYARAEDYELWTRVPGCYKLANLGRILLFYRRHAEQVSAEFFSVQSAVTSAIRKKQLERLGIELTVETLDLHVKISRKKPEISILFLERAASWLLALQEKKFQLEHIDSVGFTEIAGRYWWETCFHATSLGFRAWNTYFGSELSRRAKITTTDIVVFWVKCLLKKSNNSMAA
jgi:glycosyltransferase involved in cell wall biosynthesis